MKYCSFVENRMLFPTLPTGVPVNHFYDCTVAQAYAAMQARQGTPPPTTFSTRCSHTGTPPPTTFSTRRSHTGPSSGMAPSSGTGPSSGMGPSFETDPSFNIGHPYISDKKSETASYAGSVYGDAASVAGFSVADPENNSDRIEYVEESQGFMDTVLRGYSAVNAWLTTNDTGVTYPLRLEDGADQDLVEGLSDGLHLEAEAGRLLLGDVHADDEAAAKAAEDEAAGHLLLGGAPKRLLLEDGPAGSEAAGHLLLKGAPERLLLEDGPAGSEAAGDGINDNVDAIQAVEAQGTLLPLLTSGAPPIPPPPPALALPPTRAATVKTAGAPTAGAPTAGAMLLAAIQNKGSSLNPTDGPQKSVVSSVPTLPSMKDMMGASRLFLAQQQANGHGIETNQDTPDQDWEN